MSKIYSIDATQDLKRREYNLFENREQENNLSPTYVGILKIFKEIFKQVDIAKIISNK
ncbi:hypothetical protein [Dysgonomonas sp. 521]|uniref:hypothetical protein n=1 Tax=Dysgonomonas sp. 521 TaxID=2302932 RepID=UPI0016273037|nr:hypothetical protein [Dysgonomonas sp. 521]